MRSFRTLLSVLFLSVLCCGCNTTPDVVFSVTTLPAVEGVVASVDAERSGDEWLVSVDVKNTTSEPVTLKVKLVAEPDLKADSYLFPGIN